MSSSRRSWVWLDGAASSGLEHAELDSQLDLAGRELLRLLMQDHVDLRAVRESRVAVVAADGGCRTRVETGHTRALGTIFGEITVTRIAYREPGQANLHPADAALNLPVEKHSHGLRQLAAIESSRGSFDGALEAIERSTGQHLGKRQVQDLASRAAIDFDAFYRERTPPSSDPCDVLVLSCDGKGVVMRPDALRPATAKAAANTNPKFATRLSKGEKRNRKRSARSTTSPRSRAARPTSCRAPTPNAAAPPPGRSRATSGSPPASCTTPRPSSPPSSTKPTGCNDDFDAYWTWHLGQEHHRVHQSRYLNGAVPRAA